MLHHFKPVQSGAVPEWLGVLIFLMVLGCSLLTYMFAIGCFSVRVSDPEKPLVAHTPDTLYLLRRLILLHVKNQGLYKCVGQIPMEHLMACMMYLLVISQRADAECARPPRYVLTHGVNRMSFFSGRTMLWLCILAITVRCSAPECDINHAFALGQLQHAALGDGEKAQE